MSFGIDFLHQKPTQPSLSPLPPSLTPSLFQLATQMHMYCILFVALFLFLSVQSVQSSQETTDTPNYGRSRCITTTENHLDIIFVVDRSLSTNSYSNKLNLILADIIKNVLPINSRIGLINFSGCLDQYTFKQCKQQDQIKEIISLNDDYSLPNDLDNILDAVKATQSGIHYKITII